MISEDEQRTGEEQVQKLTDKYIEIVEQTGKHKETEVMAV
jgi:ribosome recycling factor